MISLDEDGRPSLSGRLLAVVVPDTVHTDIHLIGDLDLLTAQILHTLIEQQIATGHRDVRIDLTDLNDLAFCDVSGLRALLGARRRLAALDGRLMLLRAGPRLMKVAALRGYAAELGIQAVPRPAQTPTANRLLEPVHHGFTDLAVEVEVEVDVSRAGLFARPARRRAHHQQQP